MSTQRSYTAAEKLKVVRYAEAHSNRAAGREFDARQTVFSGIRSNTWKK